MIVKRFYERPPWGLTFRLFFVNFFVNASVHDDVDADADADTDADADGKETAGVDFSVFEDDFKQKVFSSPGETLL